MDDFRKHCQLGGCENKTNKCCVECGFQKEEARRRKQIPAVMCKDGLRRKIIRRKTVCRRKDDAVT